MCIGTIIMHWDHNNLLAIGSECPVVEGRECLESFLFQGVKRVYCLCFCSGCDAFRKSCAKAGEPEDVTVGLIIGKWSSFVNTLDMVNRYKPLPPNETTTPLIRTLNKFHCIGHN